MSILDEDGRFIPDNSEMQVADLGDPDEVYVNGQRFAFENVKVFRYYRHRRDVYPAELRADWDNVQWIDPEGEIALTVPACFLDSAPMSPDRRQPCGVTWADLMERALIEMAEKAGRWY